MSVCPLAFHARRAARGACLAACLLAGAAGAEAATSWRTLKPSATPGEICIAVQGQQHTYHRLDREAPAVVSLRGPRRLKIVTRYVFGSDDPDERRYVLRVVMDGREVLRKSLRGRTLDGIHPCGRDTEVSALRRSTIDVPTGRHDIQVFAETEGSGRVASRFYRESRQQKTRDVAFAPEGYAAVRHLQFASGTQSTYYWFHADKSLRFAVTGPTTLKLYTRLDFDHTMNGSQAYALELLRDGESQNVFHYHTEKLSAAAYVESPDILPGSRKLLRIPVPRGSHRFEIRCVRPEACGIAAQIRIPESDVKPR